MKVKSCFPEGTNSHQQFEKLLEEVDEVQEAAEQGDKLETAKEALDVATVAVGLAELATDRLVHEENKKIIDYNLQRWLDKKIEEKHKSYERGLNSGLEK